MVTIKQDIVSNSLLNNKTYGTGNPRTKLVVHQTGNTDKGADAQMHADYQHNGAGGREASWHIQSDDKEIIQSYPFTYRCYHASTGNSSNGGNMVGIGWEIAINSDGNYTKAIELASEGIAQVMKQENIPMSGLVRHHDEDPKSQRCPRQIMDGQEGITWIIFKNMVKGHLDGTITTVNPPKTNQTNDSVAGADLVKNENGYFLATENIKVRNAPSTSAKQTGTFPKGSSLEYFKVYEGNGYRWLQYVGNSGNTLYIPYRESGSGKEQWGTFHSSRPSENQKSVSELADEVDKGLHGDGEERKKSLGSRYNDVQKEVNRRYA